MGSLMLNQHIGERSDDANENEIDDCLNHGKRISFVYRNITIFLKKFGHQNGSDWKISRFKYPAPQQYEPEALL